MGDGSGAESGSGPGGHLSLCKEGGSWLSPTPATAGDAHCKPGAAEQPGPARPQEAGVGGRRPGAGLRSPGGAGWSRRRRGSRGCPRWPRWAAPPACCSAAADPQAPGPPAAAGQVAGTAAPSPSPGPAPRRRLPPPTAPAAAAVAPPPPPSSALSPATAATATAATPGGGTSGDSASGPAPREELLKDSARAPPVWPRPSPRPLGRGSMAEVARPGVSARVGEGQGSC